MKAIDFIEEYNWYIEITLAVASRLTDVNHQSIRLDNPLLQINQMGGESELLQSKRAEFPDQLYLLTKYTNMTDIRVDAFEFDAQLRLIEDEDPFIPESARRKVVQLGWYGGELLVFDTWRRSIECYPNGWGHAFTVARDDSSFLELLLVLRRFDTLQELANKPPYGPEQPLFYDSRVYRRLRLKELERAGGCSGARLFFGRSWGEE